MIWKIAWGSIRRHGRRSLLILGVVAISVAAMLFVTGMMDGMREDFFETMVSSGGHLQVDHVGAADALDPFSLELLITDWQAMRDWFTAQPEVVRAEPILTFGALVLMEGSNVPMVGYGVLPDTGFFSDVRGGVEEGRFLSVRGVPSGGGAGAPDEGGEDDDEEDSGLDGQGAAAELPEVMISRRTAEMLDVAVDEEVSILVEDSTGSPYYLAYRVVGVFRSDSAEFDQSSFLISHTAAQELLYLGDETREVRAVLSDETLAQTVGARFAAAWGIAPPAEAGAAGGGASGGGSIGVSGGAAGDGDDSSRGGGAATSGGAVAGAHSASNAGASGPAVTASAEAAGDERSAASQDGQVDSIRIRTWREINGGIAVLLDMFDVFMYAINLLIVIVAATVITNAILMNVFEKIGEFGTMRAIGLTRRGQFGLVIAEGTGYGVIGSLAGLAIGVPLVLWFSTHGINFGEMMDSFGLGREVTTRLDPTRAAVTALFGALVAVAGSLYAGWVAMRMSVIESIRGSA